MMETKKIRELIRLIRDTDVEELEVWDAEDRVRIRRAAAGNGHDPGARAVAMPALAAEPAAPPATAPEKAAERPGHRVASPLVGTFYRASSPGADPFVEVGSRVRKGDTLCIIEAMKLMNEIEAEVAGVVAQVLVENGQAVEYGQTLFVLDPD